jgi:hypothetical protein
MHSLWRVSFGESKMVRLDLQGEARAADLMLRWGGLQGLGSP